MAYYGADPGQLRALAAQFTKGAALLESHAMTLHSLIGSSTNWQGPDAEQFRSQWAGRDFKAMSAAIDMLRASAQDLKRNADEQEGVSGGGGAPSASAAPTNAVEAMEHVKNSVHDDDGVRIEKVVGPDGQTRLIVYMKGVGASDDRTIARGYLLAKGWVDPAIRDKIDAALAGTPNGKNTDIMLVGFSEGGMDAQNLAKTGDYHVTTMVTYGSPVITDDQPGIETVHMHAKGDDIPAQGALFAEDKNPFVGRAMEQAASPDNHIFESNGKQVHSESGYTNVASDFDNSDDPRFAGVKSSMKNFSGVVVETRE